MTHIHRRKIIREPASRWSVTLQRTHSEFRIDAYKLAVGKTGARGHSPLTSPCRQKSTACLQGSNVATFTLRNNVVRLGSGPSGSGIRTILPGVSSSLSQYGSPAGGRVTFSREPVTLPHITTSRLWLELSVSNLASAYKGTHCRRVGSLFL